MKNIYLISILTVVIMLFAGSAMATPGKSNICSNCHNESSSVSAAATSQGCIGDQETFRVTVSSAGNASEGWAVFDGNSNLFNDYGTAATFQLPNGTYDVWGVSLDGGGMGGSNSDSITVDCAGSGCTDNDGDGYFAEIACATPAKPVDCDDSDRSIHPGAEENCTDGIDNDCDNLVDEQDPNAVNCPVPCTDADADGFFAEGRVCGGEQDCNDNSEFVYPGAVEICDNLIDDDCDGYPDQTDTDCGACIPSAPRERGKKKCSDGIDNDCDGGADSLDPDDCQPRDRGPVEICDDNLDNDGDGKIDCSDKKDCGKALVCR